MTKTSSSHHHKYHNEMNRLSSFPRANMSQQRCCIHIYIYFIISFNSYIYSITKEGIKRPPCQFLTSQSITSPRRGVLVMSQDQNTTIRNGFNMLKTTTYSYNLRIRVFMKHVYQLNLEPGHLAMARIRTIIVSWKII